MQKKVMIIDDESSICKSFSMTLEDAGYAVDTASTEEEGIEKLRYDSFNMILIALTMPGMKKGSTLREIRKDHRDVPVYITTAFHAEFFESLRNAVENNLEFELLRKPLESDDLCAVVDSVTGI